MEARELFTHVLKLRPRIKPSRCNCAVKGQSQPTGLRLVPKWLTHGKPFLTLWTSNLTKVLMSQVSAGNSQNRSDVGSIYGHKNN